VTVRALWTRRLSRGPLRVLSLPLAAAAFASYVRSRRPDVAISFLVRANLVMVMSSWFGNPLPRIISERIHSTIYAGSSPTAFVMRTLVRTLYPRADSAVAISEGVKTSLVGIGLRADRIRVIHNPQDIAGITAAAARAGPRGDAVFQLVTVARLDAQKDLPTLLHALREVRDVEPRARLVVLGEGPDAAALRRLADELGVADAVEWRGWAPPYEVMAGSDVFVLSSRYEGFGNVIVEALACGVPVVSTDSPSGPREILAGGEYGLLVPVGNSPALAAAILRLRDDPDLRAALRERGRRRAADFDVASVAPAYLEVLGVGDSRAG
jgi:glycosyltransferase involved in cell wall biosynthesis